MNRVNQVVNRVVNREIIATIETINGVHNFDFEIFGGHARYRTVRCCKMSECLAMSRDDLRDLQ